MIRILRNLSVFACITFSIFGQSVTGAGYLPQAPIAAAPGQIITFYTSGIGKSIFDTVHAPAGQLPVTLAGITVSLRQGTTTTAVPILEVRPVSPCPTIISAQATSATGASINICASLIAVTVQIPYEMSVCPGCTRPANATAGLLVVSDGTAQSAIELNPLSDQVHVLTQCDLFLTSGPFLPPVSTGLPCGPVVTHADGTTVSAYNAAKPGEMLTAWAVGLGATVPAAKTGQPAAAPLPLTGKIYIRTEYGVNLLPGKPYSVTLPLLQPAYAGLAPGFPGLYQINFVVPPEPLQGTPRCVQPGAAIVASGGNFPQSNLTVSFGGSTSFDGAGICVNTQIPVD